MPSFHKLVILFTRYPLVGKCKSRLIPTLGAEGALNIHRQLVSHILKVLGRFISEKNNTALCICYHGGTLQKMQRWLGNTHTFMQQEDSNLGERMATAMIYGLKNGQDTILIGSDCPGIRSQILEEALESLQHKDIAIGPAYDGGYYLIGVAANIPAEKCRKLFKDIQWGTKLVFNKTVDQADSLGLSSHILKKLHDIDTAEDLRHFHYCPNPE